MRPVNLIPPEERRGERAPTRTGPLVYVVPGVLAVVLLAVTLLVTTSNTISSRKAERDELTQEKASVLSKSKALQQYTSFKTVQEKRVATVTSLAQSRFDWERVLREIALVLPDDVWLINLSGSVSPEIRVEKAPGFEVRQTVQGPALEIVGCGRSLEAVAGFLASLRDIDGVTRVTAVKSEKPGEKVEEATGDNEDDCRTRDSTPRFEIVAAFDQVQVDPSAIANQTAEPGRADEVRGALQQANDSRQTAAEGAKKAGGAKEIIPTP